MGTSILNKKPGYIPGEPSSFGSYIWYPDSSAPTPFSMVDTIHVYPNIGYADTGNPEKSWATKVDKTKVHLRGYSEADKESNPDYSYRASVAATKALAHAIMGALASPGLYIKLLEDGYIYTHVGPTDDEPPQAWIDAAYQCIDEEFPIFSWKHGAAKKVLIAGGNYTYGALRGFGTHQETYPHFGTAHDPTYNTHASGQPTVEIPIGEGKWKKYPVPFVAQGNSHVPDWVNGGWHAIPWDVANWEDWHADIDWGGFEPLSPTGAQEGEQFVSPRYAASIKINVNSFISAFMLKYGIIKHDPQTAEDLLLNVDSLGAVPDENDFIMQPGAAGGKIPVKKGKNSSTAKAKAAKKAAAESTQSEEYWVSFLDDYEQNQQKSNGIPSPNELQIKANKLSPHATHYVFSGATKLKRSKKVIKNRPTRSKRAKIIGELSNYDVVFVEEEFVGSKHKWHKIKIPSHKSFFKAFLGFSSDVPDYYSTSMYMRASVLKKLPNTAASLDRVYICKNNRNYSLPDWTKMDDREIFFDKKRCDYCIVVEPTKPQTNIKYAAIKAADCGKALNEIKHFALAGGVEELLKFYNKQSTAAKILGAFKGPYVDKEGGWHLGSRPSSKLKILVRFPAKYFDAIPEIPEDFRGVFPAALAPSSHKERFVEVCHIW